MKVVHLIIICIALLTTVGCGDGKSVRQLPHLGNTPYQQDSILVAYAVNPKRALTLLDSALLLGNISDYRGQFIRAKIYSKSLMEQRLDSAILICKALLSHDSVRNEPVEQENILDMLIATSRAKPDYEQYIHWATQKAELCQQQGEENERWRTEADIGLVMTYLGQIDEGLAKLDEAISCLDAPGSIDRMDAFIVTVKRKINALNDLHRFDEVIPLAQRILDRLNHFESNLKDYAEDSYRLPWSDNPTDRDRYLDFSRAQAWGLLATAYSHTQQTFPQQTHPRPLPVREGSSYSQGGDSTEELSTPLPHREGPGVGLPGVGLSVENLAFYYLSLFDNSDYGKTFSARRMIAPTQMALGMYDEALTTYDEVERRMGADTLNNDYAVILRSRAIAAYARAKEAEANSQFSIVNSQLKSAYDYQTRYANLSKDVSDSLHRSEAHDYSARYHAYEQQLEIQEKEAEAERSRIVSLAVAVIALLAIAFALYFFRQKRIVSEKNRVLVRMINEQTLPQETPKTLPHPLPVREGSDYIQGKDSTVELTTPLPRREGSGEGLEGLESLPGQPMVNDQCSMFNEIDTAIRSERLYSNVTLQRQNICDRFGISRHTLNDLLTEYADGLSFPQYINAIRVEEALRLLREEPSKTVAAIAAEVGFTPANLREQFKRQYGMTPAEFLKQQEKM